MLSSGLCVAFVCLVELARSQGFPFPLLHQNLVSETGTTISHLHFTVKGYCTHSPRDVCRLNFPMKVAIAVKGSLKEQGRI